MFTGIVEEIGKVLSVKQLKDLLRVEIETQNTNQLGDSISINGCCLTVAELKEHSFCADIVYETLKKTTLRELSVGDFVNLERAMRATDRFGGHIVQGHIDGTGLIKSRDNLNQVTIETDPNFLSYIVSKGSIAVDGVSLTIKSVTNSTFSFAMIPHTASVTILGRKEVGACVNLEFDILAKYMEKWVDRTSN